QTGHAASERSRTVTNCLTRTVLWGTAVETAGFDWPGTRSRAAKACRGEVLKGRDAAVATSWFMTPSPGWFELCENWSVEDSDVLPPEATAMPIGESARATGGLFPVTANTQAGCGVKDHQDQREIVVWQRAYGPRRAGGLLSGCTGPCLAR